MRPSVVVQTYASVRLAGLEEILHAWLLQASEVWVADCSGRFKTALPVTVISTSRDVGNRLRHCVALLTSGDLVIKADDDILPLPGLVAAFESFSAPQACILGLIGRRFHGPAYYGGTEFFASNKVAVLTEVDFAGVVTCAPRRLLPFDLRSCGTPIEDLHWQMGANPEARKFVIPTSAYRNLPDSKSASCLFHKPGAREERETYYRAMFAQNYDGRPWAERHPGKEKP